MGAYWGKHLHIWYTYTPNMRVKLPDRLAERVEEIAEQKGYNGVTDFTREAVRIRIEEVDDGD